MPPLLLGGDGDGCGGYPAAELRCTHLGCGKLLMPVETHDHEATCKFRVMACMHGGCKIKLRAMDFEDHFRNCEFRIRACEWCKQDVQARFFEGHAQRCTMKDVCKLCGQKMLCEPSGACDQAAHLRKCPMKPIACFHDGCGLTVKSFEYEKHCCSCPHRLVKCTHAGCDVEAKAKDLEAHRASCALRPLPCPNPGCGAQVCGHGGLPPDLQAHMETCDYRRVPCPNDGCGRIAFVELLAHMPECPHRIVQCPHEGCGLEMKALELGRHVGEDCPQRSVVCGIDGCGSEMQAFELKAHEAKCPCRLVACPNSKDCVVMAKDMKRHAEACRHLLVSCPHVGCQAVVKAMDLPAHMMSCGSRVVMCLHAGCGLHLNANAETARQEHMLSCDHRPTECRHRGCGERLKARDLPAHEEACVHNVVECPSGVCGRVRKEHMPECPHRLVACDHAGCDMEGAAKDLVGHKQVCQFRLVDCEHEGCGVRVAARALREHAKTCEMRVVQCPGCSKSMRARELPAHDARCPERQVACPHAGCGGKLKVARDWLTAAGSPPGGARAQLLVAKESESHAPSCPFRPQPLIGCIKDKVIPDEAIEVSSNWQYKKDCRMDGDGWPAKRSDVSQWIEWHVAGQDQSPLLVSAIHTKGNFGGGMYYVTAFRLSYSDDGENYCDHPQAFEGNADVDSAKENEIVPPILARVVRLCPTAWRDAISLRAELVGSEAVPICAQEEEEEEEE